MDIQSQPMPDVTRRFNTSQRRELAKIARSNKQLGERTVIVQPGDDIQLAIDSLNNSGGGVVLLKSGTHTLKATLTGYSEISIVGEGIDQSIIECGGNAYGLSYVGTVSAIKNNFELRDFTLQNSNNTAGVDIQYADFWTLNGIKITSCDQKGIRIQDAQSFLLVDVISSSNTGNGIEIAASNNRNTQAFSFINCQSSSNAAIGYAVSVNTNDLFYGRFISCQANSNTGDGWDFSSSGASALDTVLVGCIANANSGIGFDGDSNCQRITLLGCQADVNTGDGFEIAGADCQVDGCYSSTPFDFQGSGIFVGNNVAVSSSVDPSSRVIIPETFLQSGWNKSDNTRTVRRTYFMKNTSGGSLVAGDVVVLKAVATGDEVTTTTTGGDDKVFGMIDGAVANNAWGRVLVEGLTTKLKVDGTNDIAIGDFLSCFTTAKIAQKASAGDQCFAIALEAYTTDDSSGVIDALLIQPRFI